MIPMRDLKSSLFVVFFSLFVIQESLRVGLWRGHKVGVDQTPTNMRIIRIDNLSLEGLLCKLNKLKLMYCAWAAASPG